MSLKEEWYKQEINDNENTNFHSPLEEEYSFYKAVKLGDMDYVRTNLESGSFINPKGKGILSKNSLTNLRYHYVIAVAMITRQCVEGGMELEQAYRLSD
ncbi:MAG: AraC family transcriptional regulator, partial [Lachnospiraceae bacterium]|nr:AraC family transcriptional regulator [Lachnospiraceae bacterium]